MIGCYFDGERRSNFTRSVKQVERGILFPRLKPVEHQQWFVVPPKLLRRLVPLNRASARGRQGAGL